MASLQPKIRPAQCESSYSETILTLHRPSNLRSRLITLKRRLNVAQAILYPSISSTNEQSSDSTSPLYPSTISSPISPISEVQKTRDKAEEGEEEETSAGEDDVDEDVFEGDDDAEGGADSKAVPDKAEEGDEGCGGILGGLV